MRKLALLWISSLLVTTNLFAEANKINLSMKITAKSILHNHTLVDSKKGSFAIVYGGQDISRGSIDSQAPRVDRSVLIG